MAKSSNMTDEEKIAKIRERVETRRAGIEQLRKKRENIEGLIETYKGSREKALAKVETAERMLDKYSVGLVELDADIAEKQSDLLVMEDIADKATLETPESIELRIWINAKILTDTWMPGMDEGLRLEFNVEFNEKMDRLRELDRARIESLDIDKVNQIFYNRGYDRNAEVKNA